MMPDWLEMVDSESARAIILRGDGLLCCSAIPIDLRLKNVYNME